MTEVCALNKEEETHAYYKCKKHLDLGSAASKNPYFYLCGHGVTPPYSLIANNVLWTQIISYY